VEEDEEKRVEQWESEKMKNFRSKTFLHQNLKPLKTLNFPFLISKWPWAIEFGHNFLCRCLFI
jgi:hypothetical protein